MLAGSVVSAMGGAAAARAGWYNQQAWGGTLETLGVSDAHAFVTVAYIHNGSYFGGLAGLMIAMVCVWKATRRQTAASA